MRLKTFHFSRQKATYVCLSHSMISAVALGDSIEREIVIEFS